MQPIRFLHNRLCTSLALVLTLIALMYTSQVTGATLEWLHSDYGVRRWQFMAYYAVWGVVLVLAFVMEPLLRRELRQGGALSGIALLGLLVAGLSVLWLADDQPFRLFRGVPIVSVAIAYTVAMAALTVLLAVDAPLAAPSRRMMRYATAWLAVMIVSLVVAHGVSVGHFARLDDVFDELMLTGNMTNFATNGRLTSSFLNEVYGTFDPSTPRYFLAGGLYLRLLGNQSLTALRSWPLVVGMVGAGLMALVLWREPGLRLWQRLLGLVLLLAGSAYVRMTHNMRMDIGLVVYATLMVLLVMTAVRSPKPGRLYFIAGLILYIGLETQSFVALLHGVAYGLVMLIQVAIAHRDPWWQQLRRSAIPYAMGAAVACTLFLIVHFVPETQDRIVAVRSYGEIYADTTHSVGQGFPLRHWPRSFRFSLLLSPVEPFVIAGTLALSLFAVPVRIRWFAITATLSVLLNWALLNNAHGYNNVVLPIVALCGAYLVRHRFALMAVVFVLLPAYVAAPVHDMVHATRAERNQQLIRELSLLDWRIPDGAHVVGSDVFWIVLQQRTQYTGASALKYIGFRHNVDDLSPDILAYLNPDIVICNPDNESWLCSIADEYYTAEPIVFDITDATYHVYLPEGSG